MPLVMTQIEEAPRDTRMTLVHDEFLNEYGGRLKAGTVVLVDAATARKWETKQIAVPSAITDKTLREQKEAALQRIREEIEALERPPVLTGPLYQGLAPADREQLAARMAPRTIPTLTRAKAPRRQSKARTARTVAPPSDDGVQD